jgi:NTP pyrophosphatase (non-canonical NTP hydrolase)
MEEEQTLRQLQAQVDKWIQTKGVRYFSELTNMGVLMEEVGELARILTRTYGDQSFKKGERADNIAEELADVLFVLVCLANQTGVDLQKAMEEAFHKRNTRDATRHINNPKLK